MLPVWKCNEDDVFPFWRIVRVKHLISLLAVVVFFSCSRSAKIAERERIESFRSIITVNKDSTALVEENIRVFLSGTRRGLVREIPDYYIDPYGRSFRANVRVVGAWRDGTPDAFLAERKYKTVRVAVGKTDELLGEDRWHDYRIRYRTDLWLDTGAASDGLTWNVTGSEWAFDIERASAEVVLPPDLLDHLRYVGADTVPLSTNSGEYVTNIGFIDGRRSILFERKKPLSRGQIMTVKVRWAKGLVDGSAH